MNQYTDHSKILFFASEHDLDYLPQIAQLRPNTALTVLTRPEASLRLFARDMAKGSATCSLHSYTDQGPVRDACTVKDALDADKWDVVVLSQMMLASAMYGSYNTDLEFLLDCVDHHCPGARVFLAMPWAWQQTLSGPRASDLITYFDGSQSVMYNAIVTSMEYALKRFGHRLAGVIPVGAAIQHLRNTVGDNLCANGLHLSEPVAQAAAALTLIRTLYPGEAVALREELSSADEAASCACTHGITRLDIPHPVRVEDVSKQEDVTVAQTAAPYKLHFPDVGVTADGTVFVSAYEQVYHYPEVIPGDCYGWQGSGRIVIWKSTDNGRTFDTEHPVLVIDEHQLDRWGVAKVLGRYERWKAGEDYILNADPRDPNFIVAHADLNGDGVAEEVLLHTFCMVDYHEDHLSHTLNMHWSTDGGKTWSVPQELESVHSPELIKRGDAAVFADGQILVPTYRSNKIILLLMQWSPEQGKWINIRDTLLPDLLPEKSEGFEFNELSFIVPDPAGDEVYGFVRANGAIIRSADRGLSWQLVGEEEGYIHQPGFTPIDEHRAFVTWARIASPRTVYGKVFYHGASWSDTAKRVIYASPDPSPHDMADPSCRRLADGRIYTVGYDTAYRSIVGTFDDPNSAEFDPIELDETLEKVVLYQGAASIPEELALPATYTIKAKCSFESEGVVSLMLAGGDCVDLVQGRHGIPAGSCTVGVLVLGGAVYLQVSDSEKLVRDKWQYLTTCSRQSGRLNIKTQNAAVEQVELSHRLQITMDPVLVGIQGGAGVLVPSIQPRANQLSWQTSDPGVATVDNGVVRYVGPGTARVTLDADGAQACCDVTVSDLPAEVASGGVRKVLFREDFESYPTGKNAFWDGMEQKGYSSAGVEPTYYSSYDIANGPTGRCLKLNAYNNARTWVKVDMPIEGDYTACFDFTFTGGRTKNNFLYPGHCLYLNLWQDSGIHGFLDLTPEGIRCEYQNERAEVVNDPESFHEEIIYPLNVWHSIRVARVNGAIYARVWPKGETEPEKWDLVGMHSQYRTDNKACFRMQYYAAGPAERSVFIDNLVITRCEDK